ncbi:hypothetical protein FOH10_22935 [Nocardia otitidiscaviarum]|uniref:Uncharacterized protein n=1 Tax=Nocardia otitidiscaviarum TaxID=1823 RepID=A0A516NQH8_9NOCA|nr:hypothetical protein [Nocardia otitidiscaviarum]MCP9620279.1 hypothetical protein [Nocardia otitidiscaviarum]QDP81144.1 hypothetical protein FOH10_22935 [Nocardia otitidiscaviarum]
MRMTTGNRESTRPLIAVGAGCAALAATLLTMPTAAATATRIGVEPSISFGSATNYGAGCTYPVNVYVDDPVTPVVIYDNGVAFAVVRPSGAIATGHWTPAAPGEHRLQAIQPNAGGDVVPYVDLTVGVGLNSGSGCIVTH